MPLQFSASSARRNGAPSVANGKWSRRVWVDGDIGDRDLVDLGGGRPAVAPANKLVDGFRWTLRFQRDNTVIAVPNPTEEAQFLRALSATSAVSNPLDPPANHR